MLSELLNQRMAPTTTEIAKAITHKRVRVFMAPPNYIINIEMIPPKQIIAEKHGIATAAAVMS